MNKLTNLIMVIVLLAIAILPMFVCEAVQASGVTEMVITISDVRGFYSEYGLWATVTHQDTASSSIGSAIVGYHASASTTLYYRTHSSMMKFDITDVPDISNISYMKVRLYCTQKDELNSPTFQAPYIALYDTFGSSNSSIPNADIDNFNDGQPRNLISNYYSWYSISAGTWTTFTISPADWETVLTPQFGGQCFIELCTLQHALDQIPMDTWSVNGAYAMYMDGSNAELIIGYTPAAAEVEFTYETNAAIDTTVVGDEVADNITLTTLRCMYANEDLQFCVTGNSGAPLNLRLVNNSGVVLDTITDSVRVNGFYYWRIDSLASTYRGIVQVKETTWGLSSPWVWIEPQVSITEANMCVYAGATEYPQYTYPFSSYVIRSGEYMIVHWKTNIDAGVDDCDNITLGIYSNGDSTNYKFLQTFTDLRSYFQGTTTNQNAAMHWRFMVFTPKAGSGINLANGLVYNLNIDFVPEFKGYLEAIIQSTTDSELTTPHSAYWYISSAADGIGIKLDKSVYKPDENIGFNIAVGKECNADEYLQYMSAVVMETGDAVNSYVENGDNHFELDSITAEGNYNLRVTLYNSDVTSYEYIYQIPFEISETGMSTTVPGGSQEDVLNWLESLFKQYSLDSTMGHWLIILGAMVLMILIGVKSKRKTLTLVLPLMILGIGIIIGWVDTWVIVLLALGAGLTIFSMIRKKAAGGGSGGEG